MGVMGCSATPPKQHRLDSCEGKREMKISKWIGYEGNKYLGCTKCEDTQWLNEVKKLKETPKSSTPLATTPMGAQFVIDTTLEEFCTKFQTNMNFKNK
ncbi:hypothetical protein BVC80_209g5 [Macleaya cordata]|uniref:Uncharacterized protein n=1 Tax=Macleaya cordata TaxID=56857 RepID=A0A200QD24_MACCD|nr:hypothetical protein BVC80_209g5 [Macleaya cordata]